MAAALVVAHGPTVYLLRPGSSRPEAFPTSVGSERSGRPGVDADPAHLPEGLLRILLDELRQEEVRTPPGPLRRSLGARLGRSVGPLAAEEWREAKRSLPVPHPDRERAYLLGIAQEELERALRSPEEVLITLAREEQRFGRALGREARAAEAWLALPGTALAAHADRWTAVRSTLERHHAELLRELAAAAEATVPNLTEVVGARVAARLVSAAGGIAPLGRLPAARLQLLGARRRPTAERGPEYGVIFLAERMEAVPPDRRGAFARSLAALAVIAARADATTHAPLGPALRARRDRRVERLRKERR